MASASTVFFTKKQKQLMRERRKKKKLGAVDEKEEQPLKKHAVSNAATTSAIPAVVASAKTNNNKRHLQEASAKQPTHSNGSKPARGNVVLVPANLTNKQAKKFRKDARRQAREDGRDETLLEFVIDGATEPLDMTTSSSSSLLSPTHPPTKKRKRNVPNINEIVKLVKKEKAENAQEQIRKDDEDQLTKAYKARYVAVDCEMVGTGSEGHKSALARVSLVDWDGAVLLDTFVQVPSRVTDFRTHVSGIQPKHIQSTSAMDVVKCRNMVADMLKGKILVGHALKNDLHALMLQHPKEDIRDTAKYRPLQRYGGDKWRPRKLRDLVKERLNLLIQQEGQSHDSVDDARATMELFKSVRKEWEEELNDKNSRKRIKK